MQKFLRSFVLASTVVLAAAPAHADRMGTNPRPTPTPTPQSMTQAVLSFFGF